MKSKFLNGRYTWHSLIIGIIILWTTGTLFLELAQDVWRRNSYVWDVTLSFFLYRVRSPLLDGVMTAVTFTGGEIIILIALACIALFWWKKQHQVAFLTAVSFIGANIFGQTLKFYFMRPRPNWFPPLRDAIGYSFPSGHTLAAVALYGFLAIWLWQHRRKGLSILAGMWAVLVGVSRVYLGVHYPSDVLASIAIGTFWLTLIVSLSPLFHKNAHTVPVRLNDK